MFWCVAITIILCQWTSGHEGQCKGHSHILFVQSTAVFTQITQFAQETRFVWQWQGWLHYFSDFWLYHGFYYDRNAACNTIVSRRRLPALERRRSYLMFSAWFVMNIHYSTIAASHVIIKLLRDLSSAFRRRRRELHPVIKQHVSHQSAMQPTYDPSQAPPSSVVSKVLCMYTDRSQLT